MSEVTGASQQSPRVTVVIPNWNGARLLRTCLNALTAQTYRDFEIILVDNGSADESRDLVAREYPDVKFLALEKNLGFVGACNAGMRAATSEIIVLLNNDTEAEAGWLAELVRTLDTNPRAGMAASKLRLFDAREKIHSAGDFFRVNGIPGNRGVWEVDHEQFDSPEAQPVMFGVCGGACAFRKTMLDEIGLFDEDFWSYCEDVDLNWRARLAGYTCAFAPKAVVYHYVSATGGGALASFHVGRNSIYVLFKDYPSSLWKKHWPKILRAQLGIAFDALKNIRGASARARLRGQFAGLWAWPRLQKKRHAVQATRRVSDQELMQVLAQVP